MIQLLSIVLPVYNEGNNLSVMYERLAASLATMALEYEVIIVDDASTDNSFEIAKRLSVQDPRIKALRLSRRFGHQISLAAGIDHARGDAIITMDSDLQHPPELIPQLVAKHLEGFEIVYTVRSKGKGKSYATKAATWLFYGMFRRIASVDLEAGTADFRLLGRKAADALRQFRERYLFLRGIVGWMGFRQAAIAYSAGPRLQGHSKYHFGRLLTLGLDALFSFSLFPMRLAAGVGLVFSLIAILYGGYVFFYRVTHSQMVPGWTSVMLVLLFFGGLQLLTLGILGEYLGRVYEETKERPLYLVEEVVGLGKVNQA